jgi:glutamyl-tRNA synthetase
MTLRVRFAPSPTGHLHIGGARTALSNYLEARREGGAFVLRIEDTDPERSKKEHEEQILRDLAWLGLRWTEGPDIGGPFGPYRQSERYDRYRAVAMDLLARGLAYRCNATPEELDQMRAAQSANGEDPRYDRRNRDKDLGPDCGPHAIRVKMPIEGVTVIDDLIKGRIEIRNELLDDLVILRTDGTPTYNFVVVVDDHDMGINLVARGDDHINNTPKQIHIYHAMGAEVPRFAHLPMILGPDGSRLSKRHGHTSLGSYRDMGIVPEAMLNYLARLGWSHGDQEVFTEAELIEHFRLSDVGSSGARWDMDKLEWLNQTWIQSFAPAELVERALPFLEAEGYATAGLGARLPAIIDAFQKRSRTLVELAKQARFFFIDDAELSWDEAAVAKHLKPEAGALLSALADRLEAEPVWEEPALTAVVDALLAERGAKMGKLAQPVRVALTGQGVGPGVYEMLLGLGKETSVRRLRAGAARAA